MTLSTMVAAPLLGSLLLALVGGRLGRRAIATIGCAAVGLSLVAALWSSAPLIAATFPTLSPTGIAPAVAHTGGGVPTVQQTLYTWFSVGSLAPAVAFRLDPLAVLMVLIVTGVGFLIHLYAVSYMAADPGYRRFFCYLNLFVAAMLILVLADNLALLYLGWEGVGLCSYLLIGFWYQDPANGAAARKAFIVTRVGDAALVVGLFLLARELGTLQLDEVLQGAARLWDVGNPTVTLAAALLLVGALGKSAQLPLQVWLPDAMAGPTPVSALIHAATMVTAGVYLIARTHQIFLLAPAVMAALATIGTLTALSAACAALVQRDIKRVLAYSTISQIGYMFAALGVGAFVAAMFHLVTHAFFKALLFLSAGIVTHACGGEGDLTRLGGLRRGRALPGAAALAAVGAASLAGIPLITAGFYSKDAILWASWRPPFGHPWLLVLLFLTAGLTALYAFRWYFLIFAGPAGPASSGKLRRPGPLLLWPCVGLAAGSLLAGFLQMPASLGGQHALGTFLGPVFRAASPAAAAAASLGSATAALSAEHTLQAMAAALSLLGLIVAYHLFMNRPPWLQRLAATSWGRATHQLWLSGWGADTLYQAALVVPFCRLATWLREEPIDDLVDAVSGLTRGAHRLLSLTQSGRLRSYAAALVAGVLLLLTVWIWS
ncbi:MAG: NADH-quinone oxidoreductase subunit L [Acidobacteriota bacterium]